MQLYKQMTSDRMTAIKSRDEFAKNALSTFLGDVQTDEKRGVNIDDGYITRSLKKTLDNAKSNFDLTGNEKFTKEIEFFSKYMPKQMTESELAAAIYEITLSSESNTVGSIMQKLRSSYGGMYDGKLASEIIKSMV